MNNQQIVAGVTASGKAIVVKRTSLTPHCDQVIVNKDAAKRSVEYAKARNAIQEDYKLNFASNQALAKKIRSDSKRAVVGFLEGKVSTVQKEGQKDKVLIVTFPDCSIARL